MAINPQFYGKDGYLYWGAKPLPKPANPALVAQSRRQGKLAEQRRQLAAIRANHAGIMRTGRHK